MPNPKWEVYENKATGIEYDLTDADAQSKLTAILDGTNIDSFGDVETAVSALQPKNLSHSIAGESTVENALDAIAAGSGVTVDDAMSSSSTNPVQNKVITSALAGKQDTLTFDNFPTAGSSNPVKSGGVKSATSEIWGVIGTIEAGLTSTHAYEVGDHIICWIGFAEVIAPIAVGDELVRNVNVVEGDVAEAVSDNLRGIEANTQLIADTVGFSGANLNGTKYETRSASNVNFTVQTDGGVAIGSGTAGSSNAQTPNDSNLATASFEAKYTGQVTLIGGYNENIHIVPYDYTDSARPYKDSTKTTRLGGSDNAYPNHDVSFYMIAGHKYSMNIRVVHDTVIPSGVVVYAMLCKQELLDKSYKPYHKESVKDMVELVDYSSQCTGETGAEILKAWKIGRVAYITYQGASKTHADNDGVIDLPIELKPANLMYFSEVIPQTGEQVLCKIVPGNSAPYGKIAIQKIAGTSGSGRLAFTISYVTDN